MTVESELDELRALLGLGDAPKGEPSEFERKVTSILGDAVTQLRKDGRIEVEDSSVEAVTREVAWAVLESASLKKLPLRIVKTLVHSEHVEEVYGTDEELQSALQPFLDRL